MISGTILALGLLLVATLALLAWMAVWPRAFGMPASVLTLSALAVAFGAALGAPELPAVHAIGAQALLADDLARGMNAVFLIVASLTLYTTVEPGARDASTRAPYALFLAAVMGGLLAISAGDLLTLSLGLALFALAEHYGWAVGDKPDHVLRLVGMGALFLGLALLYSSTGTLEIERMGLVLWRWAGPRPPMLYAGAALCLGGIALIAGLLPPYARRGLGGEGLGVVLGLVCLARLNLYALGALAEEWSWSLIALALLGTAWGIGATLRRGSLIGQMTDLTIAQRGLLLLALAQSTRLEGLAALCLAVPAFALAQELLYGALRLLDTEYTACGGVAERTEPALAGLLRRDPWLGWPLLVGLLSLIGAPLTLGFIGRAATLWAALEGGLTWMVMAGLAASVVVALPYLRMALLLARRGPTSPPSPRRLSSTRLALMLGALGLVFLGLYPLPLIRLAQRIAGG